MNAALWILVFMVVSTFIALLGMRIILRPSNKKAKANEASNTLNKTGTKKDEDYIKYIISNYPAATRSDVITFLSVLDIYENTGSKEKTLEAFDSFIYQLASTNPTHAMMINGFFCGLLGTNISLSNDEVQSLSKKYTPIIIEKLNAQK